MADTPTTKDLLLEQLRQCDAPTTAKTLSSRLLAYHYVRPAMTTLHHYLKDLVREGHARRMKHGVYVHAEWEAPVPLDENYLRSWLWKWFRENPTRSVSVKGLAELHQEAFGFTADQRQVQLALKGLGSRVTASGGRFYRLTPDDDMYG